MVITHPLEVDLILTVWWRTRIQFLVHIASFHLHLVVPSKGRYSAQEIKNVWMVVRSVTLFVQGQLTTAHTALGVNLGSSLLPVGASPRMGKPTMGLVSVRIV